MEPKEQFTSKTPVLFFDGVCNLCNGIVQFILRNERDNQLHFAALQSETGQQIAKKLPPDIDSIILVENGNLYSQSTAAIRISHYLKFPYNILRYMQFVPLFIRDPIYRFIARKRYHIFGRREACMVPSPELKKRFI